MFRAEQDCKLVAGPQTSVVAKQASKPTELDKNFFPSESETKKPSEKDVQAFFETVQQNSQQRSSGRSGVRNSFSSNNLPSFVQSVIDETKPQSPFVQESPNSKPGRIDFNEEPPVPNPFESLNSNHLSSNRERVVDFKSRIKSTPAPSKIQTEPLIGSRIKSDTAQTVFRQVVGGNCTAVNCGFEGDSCAYEGTDSPSGAWIIAEGRLGNPLTGVTGPAFGTDNSYLFEFG